MQVNKALHTCTSWYAYSIPQPADLHVYNWQTFAVFLSH